MTYEDKAVGLAQQAITQLCQQVPELRSAVIIFDWRDRLAEVSVPATFWTADGAPSVDPDYVAALLSQLSRVLRMETALAMQSLAHFDDLLKDGREKLIRESKLTDAEKTTLLQTIGRERRDAAGASEPEQANPQSGDQAG